MVVFYTAFKCKYLNYYKQSGCIKLIKSDKRLWKTFQTKAVLLNFKLIQKILKKMVSTNILRSTTVFNDNKK